MATTRRLPDLSRAPFRITVPFVPFVLVLLMLVMAGIARAVFNPVECPISLAGAVGAPSCTLLPGGQSCSSPSTQVLCQYAGQPTTVDYCCSLTPANPTKAQRKLCLQGCDAAHKVDRNSAECKRGQAGSKSCQLAAKARLNDCRGFCYF
jgi:hypothetical protein